MSWFIRRNKFCKQRVSRRHPLTLHCCLRAKNMKISKTRKNKWNLTFPHSPFISLSLIILSRLLMLMIVKVNAEKPQQGFSWIHKKMRDEKKILISFPFFLESFHIHHRNYREQHELLRNEDDEKKETLSEHIICLFRGACLHFHSMIFAIFFFSL